MRGFGARGARGLVVHWQAVRTRWSTPAIRALTFAAGSCIAGHRDGVAAAVGRHRALQRTSRVAVEAVSARAAVVGSVESVRAHAAVG